MTNVKYSLETWRSIFGTREESEAQAWASLLLEWLKNQPGGRASETAMLKVGPKKIRSKAKRDTALALLELGGQAERVYDYWTVRLDSPSRFSPPVRPCFARHKPAWILAFRPCGFGIGKPPAFLAHLSNGQEKMAKNSI